MKVFKEFTNCPPFGFVLKRPLRRFQVEYVLIPLVKSRLVLRYRRNEPPEQAAVRVNEVHWLLKTGESGSEFIVGKMIHGFAPNG